MQTLKKIIPFIIGFFVSSPLQAQQSIYDIQIMDINNNLIKLSDFKDKYILVVNVASKCGFTPQYKDLETLFNKYSNKLVIIGVPCNQFGGQEPASEAEIQSFCSNNYNVSFLLTKKADVRGKNIHPLYRWLTNKRLNGKYGTTVKWNFQKYLIDTNGNLVDYFYSTTNPLSDKITSYIK